MENHQPEMQPQEAGQAAVPARVPVGFEYKRPDQLERAKECLTQAQHLSENHSPIRAAQALIEGMHELLGFMDRREFLRQRRRHERIIEEAQPRRRRLLDRVDEETVRSMLLDGGCDSWIADLTGTKRAALKLMRESLGLSPERRGGSSTERREQRKAFEAKWRPIVFGQNAGPRIQA